MIATPGEQALRRAAELCEFCPKMCRFACPVSETAQREAWTPWGKVSLATLTAGLGRAPEFSAAAAFHACTGCLRCQEYCAHKQDVPTLLFAARAAAVRSGTAPAASRTIEQKFADRGHSQDGDPLAALHALQALAAVQREADAAQSPPTADRPAALLPILMAGCEALAAASPVAREALEASRALGAPLEVAPEAALCCGRQLLEAGHTEAFAAHARRVCDALVQPEGAPPHLVFLQPACARTVRDRYETHGASLPAGTVVEHVTTHLARSLALRPDLRARPKLPGPVAYHDPCALARGLGETEAPRSLLAAAVEGGVREAVRCGRDASCCGAGGLFPETFPAVAAAIAAERKAELAETHAPAVTASPCCSSALGVPDVVTLIARWLAAR